MGGEPVRSPEKAWPAWPIFDNTEREALLEVFDSGNWWFGDKVAQFEREYAEYQGANCCVSCVNGTVALELLVQAYDIGPGDEVIVPPYTFYATSSCVSRFGATPVFVDIDESWCINPNLIEAAITDKTKAIIPVHFGGRICDMDVIMDIANRHNLVVIEDACHSWGAKWKGRGAGVLGHAGVLSFQNNKNMTAGEGGAIVTDDQGLAIKLQSLTHSGRLPDKSQLEYYDVGTNARITEMQAALLSAQLKRMPEHHARRIETGDRLTEALSAIDGIKIQPVDERQSDRSWHIFCMTIDPDTFGCSRDRAVEAIVAEGFPVGPGYPLPLHRQPIYLQMGGFEDVSCPNSEDLCDRIGMWFSHTYLLGSDEDIDDIIQIFEKVKRHAADLA